MTGVKAPVGPPSGYSNHMVSGSTRAAYDPKLTLNQIREFKKVAGPAQASLQNLKAAPKGPESAANRSM